MDKQKFEVLSAVIEAQAQVIDSLWMIVRDITASEVEIEEIDDNGPTLQ